MKKLFSLVAVLLIFAATGFGQAISVNGGSIEGTVTDSTGAVVSGASVLIEEPTTGFQRSLTTNGAGHYSIGPLTPGTYTITVSATNFSKVKVTTVVQTGTVTSANEKLTIGNSTETVEVNASALQINVDQAGVSDVITSQQIKQLPINGRNFLDLAQIEPGVILQSGESFDPTKAGYSAISVDGVSGRTTRILLDGQDITDETVGTTIFNVSQGAIGEFQLNRSTQDVSGDVTSTGQVLVSTNSGTNAFHGEAFYSFQDHRALFARSLNGSDVPLQRNQFGGSIGGPIIKDKLFFFGNAERIQQAETQASPVGSLFNGSTPGSVVAIKNAIPSPYRLTYSTVRLDYNGPKGSHFFIRGNYNVDSDASNYNSGYWLYANRDNTPGLAGGVDFTTGRFTHSFRGSYEKFHNLISDATTGNGGIYNGIPGVAFYFSTQGLYSGPNYLAPQATFQSDKQVRYDGSWSKGNHNVRYGYSFNDILGGGFAAFFGLSPRIKISASTLLANCNGVANAAPCPTDPIHGYSASTTYIGNGQGFSTENKGFGLIGGGVHDYRSGAYLTDAWKLTPSFTLNAGLRWSVDTDRANQDVAAPLCSDVDTSSVAAPCTGSGYLFAQWNPAFTGRVHQPYANFGPQVGINFSPGNHKTSIRAGFGIFYESDVFNNTTNARNVLIKQGAFFDYKEVCSSYSVTFPDGSVQTTIDGTQNGKTIKSACLAPIATGGPQIAQLQQRYQANTKSHALSANGAYVGENLNPTGAYAPTYRTPYSEQWNGGVQREIAKGIILSVDYVHNSTLKIGQTIDENHVGAARYLDKTAAAAAIAATVAAYPTCPQGSSSASIDCAITNGAAIGDFAGNGLDSGAVFLSGSTQLYAGKKNGAAFPGRNPLLGVGSFIEPIGRSGYDAMQIVYKQQKAHPMPGIVTSNLQASYSLSRIVTTSGGGSDQFFSSASWDNDNPAGFSGRGALDHTNQVTFGGFVGFKYGLMMSVSGQFFSAPPTTLTLDPGASSAAGIFSSDVTGDGTIGDLAPGTTPGAYMHQIKPKTLPAFVSNFNATKAGTLTPAGQALVSSGLFSQSQLVKAGATIQPIATVPNNVAISNPPFRQFNASFSYPIKFNRVREGLSLEPKISFYNIANNANYASFSGVLENTTTAGGAVNGDTGFVTGPNTYDALNNNRTVRGSGTFDAGGARSTEFTLKLNF